jgi:hypothetical protein
MPTSKHAPASSPRSLSLSPPSPSSSRTSPSSSLTRAPFSTLSNITSSKPRSRSRMRSLSSRWRQSIRRTRGGGSAFSSSCLSSSGSLSCSFSNRGVHHLLLHRRPRSRTSSSRGRRPCGGVFPQNSRIRGCGGGRARGYGLQVRSHVAGFNVAALVFMTVYLLSAVHVWMDLLKRIIMHAVFFKSFFRRSKSRLVVW